MSDCNKNTESVVNEALMDSGVTKALRSVIVDSSGVECMSTSVKQDEQSTLSTTLNELIETLNELNSRLTSLVAAKQTTNESLRTTVLTGSTTAVTGTLTAVTTVGTITNFGTLIPAKEAADDWNNLIVTMANINNVVVT